MRLRAGAYDFYALTPALSLTGHKEASVAHGTDYACSLTAACAVATRQDVSTQTVVLATLERKCSRLAFSITRKAENVAKAVINSVELSGIARSPAAALLCENLPTGTNDGGYEFPQGTFVQGAEPYQYSGTDEVLPKSDAAFDLQMSVTFNEADRATDLQATVPAMAFDPGKRYNFDLSLQGGFIVLTLQVTPWNVGPVWASRPMPASWSAVGRSGSGAARSGGISSRCSIPAAGRRILSGIRRSVAESPLRLSRKR